MCFRSKHYVCLHTILFYLIIIKHPPELFHYWCAAWIKSVLKCRGITIAVGHTSGNIHSWANEDVGLDIKALSQQAIQTMQQHVNGLVFWMGLSHTMCWLKVGSFLLYYFCPRMMRTFYWTFTPSSAIFSVLIFIKRCRLRLSRLKTDLHLEAANT